MPALRATVLSAALIATAGSVSAAPESTAYATVVSSTPVSVTVPVSRRVCGEGRQYVQPAPTGAGAVIGAIAGGIIGHGVGGGFGQAAATGLGAVAGAVIGDQVEAGTAPGAEVPVTRCETVSRLEDRIVGYDVMYDYAGQRYSTRLARDPGDRLAVDVRPSRGGDTPVPYDDADRGTPVPPPGAYADDEPVARYAAPPVYYESYRPVYVTPRPVYVAPPVYFSPPVISLGFGFGFGGGGHHHHRRGR